MEIRIVLRETEPPSGHLERVAPGQERATDAASFTGWLGLMSALEVVIGHPDAPPEQ
jgi:hypothetical protein